MPSPPLAIVSRRDWLRLWLKTATIGTLALGAIFLGYEIAERLWLRELVTVKTIFLFHTARGVGASVLIGTLSVLSIWRARIHYDKAFATAYAELEARMQERSLALGQTQAFTERLFDALRDRLIVLDHECRVVKANRVALAVHGEEAMVGRRCPGLGGQCSPGSDACVTTRAYRTGLPVVGQCVRGDPETGRIFEVDAYPVPDPEGEGMLVIESARDITKAQQLEAVVRYQEKLAALGVLSAGIAHDIANPLASMSSELELVEDATESSKVRESIGVLRGQVARIDRTLREMTDFARRRADEQMAVPIHVAVDDALRMIRHDPRARNVSFAIDVAHDLPALRLVEDHLVMVLVNLLINALEAMPGGGRLDVRAARDAGGVTLVIEDTGVGMTDEVRRRATEPLFTTRGGGRGTGLGLSVCNDVMRSAGGTLSIESSPGQGATVSLHFGPAAFEPSDAKAGLAGAPARP